LKIKLEKEDVDIIATNLSTKNATKRRLDSDELIQPTNKIMKLNESSVIEELGHISASSFIGNGFKCNPQAWALKITDIWLSNGHINAVQNMLKTKYNVTGFHNTDKYLPMKVDFVIQSVNEKFVQVLNAGNQHWVTVTNYDVENNAVGDWILYDSLNNPDVYIPLIKPALKRLNPRNLNVKLRTCDVGKQIGVNDCGLFALGIAIAICENVHPAKLIFEQLTMRQHYNDMVNLGTVTQFTSKYFEDLVITYHEYNVNLSGVKLNKKKEIL
jgi:hypothetical protein